MKNLKNKIAALGLMAIMGAGAVSANAGILLSDKGSNGQSVCGPTKAETGLLTQLSGVFIAGAPMLDGIIIFGRDGILVSDKGNCNASKDDGIIIFGRN